MATKATKTVKKTTTPTTPTTPTATATITSKYCDLVIVLTGSVSLNGTSMSLQSTVDYLASQFNQRLQRATSSDRTVETRQATIDTILSATLASYQWMPKSKSNSGLLAKIFEQVLTLALENDIKTGVETSETAAVKSEKIQKKCSSKVGKLNFLNSFLVLNGSRAVVEILTTLGVAVLPTRKNLDGDDLSTADMVRLTLENL